MPWLGGFDRVSQVTQTTGQEGSMRGRRSGSRVVICEGRVICTPPPLAPWSPANAGLLLHVSLGRFIDGERKELMFSTSGIDQEVTQVAAGRWREMLQVRLPGRVSVTRVTWSRSMGREGSVAAGLLWRTGSRRRLAVVACAQD